MAGTVQNVLGAVPVRYKHDPPEGPKALPIQFVLAASVQVAAQLVDLSGWQMSQVVSAIIDNTLSDVDIQVTMGVTNTVIQVPSLAAAVVPAFSNGPSFNILIQAKESPIGGEQVTITLLNFEKQPAIYSYSPIQVAGNLYRRIGINRRLLFEIQQRDSDLFAADRAFLGLDQDIERRPVRERRHYRGGKRRDLNDGIGHAHRDLNINVGQGIVDNRRDNLAHLPVAQID